MQTEIIKVESIDGSKYRIKETRSRNGSKFIPQYKRWVGWRDFNLVFPHSGNNIFNDIDGAIKVIQDKCGETIIHKFEKI